MSKRSDLSDADVDAVLNAIAAKAMAELGEDIAIVLAVSRDGDSVSRMATNVDGQDLATWLREIASEHDRWMTEAN